MEQLSSKDYNNICFQGSGYTEGNTGCLKRQFLLRLQSYKKIQGTTSENKQLLLFLYIVKFCKLARVEKVTGNMVMSVAGSGRRMTALARP
jgi:hypothetical protein